MSIDRLVKFKSRVPTVVDLVKVAEDFLSDAALVGCGYSTIPHSRIVVHLPGKPTFPFGRVSDLKQDFPHKVRGFEVFITGLFGDQPNINVVTRQTDEFTNVVADGYAKLIARFYEAELET